MLALPAPAQAHDTLLSTDPADGSTLETSPEAVVFTFSSDILDVSPLVRVSDESGEQVAEITPTVEGPTATATLPEPLAAGTYDIQWRVVSGDGHPIEGTLTLTVEQGPAPEEDAPAAPSDGESAEDAEESPQELPTATGPVEAQGESEPTAEAAESSQQEGGLSMPVLLGGLAVIVLAVVVVGFVIMRRRD
ncbi:copper resistance protein CopC [Brachybacterium vulturis]|uniref:Copper resistance protein CopC n=2 Tax=Brachybacterium vulturis TaxID=2017484 RepID=A0A291GSM5_9MICO|nr:copper resistance protein CopC [Brachybacterium vulturis]